jgi:hypothetical protein
VHYYPGTSSFTGTVTPSVKIFCNGALAAELGELGYANPVTLNGPADENKMWLVADVLFREDECVSECIVEPLKLAPTENPVIFTAAQYGANAGPPYPPVPQ